MSFNANFGKPTFIVAALATLLHPPAFAAEDVQGQIDALRRQVEALEAKAAEAPVDASDVRKLDQEVKEAGEWRRPNSLVHMAGYADVGYAQGESDDGSFNIGTFAPIFHYQYRDLVMLESELEFSLSDDGETEVALEYLTADLFLNDYVVLVAGKFLSPVGQFRQNLHPSWINKLPSAPPGFGHDGAAPVSEVGVQVRGGVPLGAVRSNYAFYIGNGPELEAVDEGGEVELEGVEAEGFGSDRDGEKVVGGRFAVLPIASLELGVSAAVGKAKVTSQEGDTELSIGDLAGEPARDYEVFGADFAWRFLGVDTRAEYVQTEIGDAASSVAPLGAKWTTWYAQASYRFLPTKWEPVLRYADFDSPHNSEDKQQWALGLNYLFAANVMAKGAYEFNDGEPDSAADEDRWLVQLAYGF